LPGAVTLGGAKDGGESRDLSQWVVGYSYCRFMVCAELDLRVDGLRRTGYIRQRDTLQLAVYCILKMRDEIFNERFSDKFH